LAKSRRQPIVADSTVAGEIVALHSLVKEVIWLRNYLKWVGYSIKGPRTLWCDNMGTVRNCEEGEESVKFTRHF
jgi:hypothetical protein